VKNANGISSIVLDLVLNRGTEYILESGISMHDSFFGANEIVKSKNIT